MIAYHVSETYRLGEDILCRDILAEQGRAPAWRWSEALEGYDGDIVSLHESLEDAETWSAEYGGTIYLVDLDQVDQGWIVRNAEGYLAVIGRVPSYAVIGALSRR